MRILIVDDYTEIVEVIRTAIRWERLGITEVLTAYDAYTARRHIQKKNVDIIISDIEMPGESGLEFLQWYREEGYTEPVILLTGFESFSYATRALKLQAADYLLKPFDVEIMELILEKNLRSLEKERARAQHEKYARWVLDNKAELKLSFLDGVFGGRISSEEEALRQNMQIRGLNIDMEKNYRLVVTQVLNQEQDLDQYGREMLQFILKNYSGEMLEWEKDYKNDNTLLYERSSSYLLVSVFENLPEYVLKDRCARFIKHSGKTLNAMLTCCISNPCKMMEFRDTYLRLAEIQEKNVVFCGETFTEEQARKNNSDVSLSLRQEEITKYLEQHDKKGMLGYLKQELDYRIQLQALDERTLKIFRLEIQQAVYGYLTNHGIRISQLMESELSIQMTKKAEQSVVDLMRWMNYFIQTVFDHENQMQHSYTIIEKIDTYIHEHYMEDIGRNEIAAEFYLVPVYVARLYKQKTGKKLKDAINEYRLVKAKRLLDSTEMLVSDIAVEVGFDNVSYFTTLFKKSFGVSPNEYRRK